MSGLARLSEQDKGGSQPSNPSDQKPPPPPPPKDKQVTTVPLSIDPLKRKQKK